MSLLITAFGRFDGGPNCSETLLRALDAAKPELEAIWGGSVALELLSVETEAVEAALGRALAAARPTHVLLMGQAGGRVAASFERVARNVRDLTVPDEAGRVGPLGPVRRGGPETLAATWPGLDDAVATLAEEGVGAFVSDDAGTHLCNQTLYLALEAGARAEPPFVATFLHLPLLPEQIEAGVPAAKRVPGCVGLPLDDMMRAVRGFLRHTRSVTA